MSGGLIPPPRRGRQFDGILHVADWYYTLVKGIAGLSVPPDTGPIPPDSFDMWPAILGGGTSPRTEVVTMPLPNPALVRHNDVVVLHR